MFSMEYAVYLYVIATILALLEIQIEGKEGWANALPCWRSKLKSWPAKIYYKIIGEKPVTGFHILINTFTFVVFHFPFFAGLQWSLVKELEVLSSWFIFWTAEDFLWFLWNPHYGLEKFNPENIWWHKNWIGPKWIARIPRDYFIEIGVSATFALIAASISDLKVFGEWFETLRIVVLLVLITSLVYSLIYYFSSKKGQE